MRRNRKDLWSLRPGDFPADRSLPEVPSDESLASNPLFRLLIWRRRSKTFERGIGELGISFLVLFFVVAVFRGWISQGLFIFMTLLLVIPARIYRPLKRRFVPAHLNSLLGVPRDFVSALVQTGVSGRECAAAIWANSMTRRNRRDGLIWFLILGGVSSVCLFVPGANGWEARGVIFALIFDSGLFFWLRSRSEGAWALKNSAFQVETLYEEITGYRDRSEAERRQRFDAAFFMPAMAILILAGSVSWRPTLFRSIGFSLFPAGAILGAWLSYELKEISLGKFEKMSQQLDTILYWTMRQEFDKPIGDVLPTEPPRRRPILGIANHPAILKFRGAIGRQP